MAKKLFLDVGGTNVRLMSDRGARATYPWAQTASLSAAITEFCKQEDAALPLESLVVAFAGLVLPAQEQFNFTNIDKPFSRAELEALANEVHVINDFAAQAALVNAMSRNPQNDDLQIIKTGTLKPGVKAVLGPGTGLGMALIDASGQILPGEGGNISLPHLPSAPARLYDTSQPLRLEDALSGQGLRRLDGRGLDPAEISTRAHAGEADALAAFGHFFDFLALACANQALQFLTIGGIYLVENLLAKNLSLLDKDRFASTFYSLPNHQEFLSRIPIYFVKNQKGGLEGAQAYLDQLKSA